MNLKLLEDLCKRLKEVESKLDDLITEVNKPVKKAGRPKKINKGEVK